MLGCRTPRCNRQFDLPDYDNTQNHEIWVFCPEHRPLHQAAALGGEPRPHWLEIEEHRRINCTYTAIAVKRFGIAV